MAQGGSVQIFAGDEDSLDSLPPGDSSCTTFFVFARWQNYLYIMMLW